MVEGAGLLNRSTIFCSTGSNPVLPEYGILHILLCKSLIKKKYAFMSPKKSSLSSLKLKLTCGDLELLQAFEKELKHFLDKEASYTFLRFSGQSRLKTVLRSPHVNKKSREHFVLRSYKSGYTIKEPSNQCVKGLIMRLKSWSGGEFSLRFCERYGQNIDFKGN